MVAVSVLGYNSEEGKKCWSHAFAPQTFDESEVMSASNSLSRAPAERMSILGAEWAGPARGKGSGVLLAVGLLLAGGVAAAPGSTETPTGGNVVGGSASISASGVRMEVLQSTQRAAIEWRSFNVGSQAQVHFQQPSGGVALNRVLDTNASQIYGRLTSTGQVFLINPNGVLFAPGAQVDVGGLVASTLQLSTADFMAGKSTFAGSSTAAVTNQGNIRAAQGGTIALVAAKIVNDGTLTAQGGNVLLGAGSKVTLDIGGPVKLQVENETLATLIQNGGAIKADGGVVWLTSQAARNLASSAINNTGLIEAQTLAAGKKGEIILFAHDGTANAGGRLDASAPQGGDGGFIETSGSKVVTSPDLQVTTRAASGRTGTWLIDPTTYTVAASGGDETGAALASRLSGTNIQLQADSTININDAVSWSANKLTLTSGGNININATLTASGTGSLAFEYGQSTAAGTGASYTVAGSAGMYIPLPAAFTWKKGSAGTTNNLIFNNGNLRFGDGTQAALNTNGLLEQPWYFDNTSVISGTTRNAWYKLTYSNYPLNLEVGAGGIGTDSWNRNGSLLNSQSNLSGAISSRRYDISKYREGTGAITSSVTLNFTGGESVKVDNTYTLSPGASFVKVDTTLSNVGTASADNLRLWVGTQDDYVATRDSQFKYKGNLTSGGFEPITAQDQQAKALKITEFNSGEGAAILFYSTSGGADTSISTCCSFSNATGINPRTSLISRGEPNGEDGSYALFIRLQNLTAGQSDGMTWYYAAAPAAQLNSVVTSVAQSAGVAAPTGNNVPRNTAVSAAQTLPPPPATQGAYGMGRLSPTAPPPSVVLSSQGALPVFNVVGGLAFVQLATPPAASAPSASSASPPGASPSTSTVTSLAGSVSSSSGPASAGTELAAPGTDAAGGGTAPNGGTSPSSGTSAINAGAPDGAGRDPFGFMRVFVVNGGLNLPSIDGSRGSASSN